MALPETIKARIERHALGQVLTSWGDLSYEQVLDSLRNDGQTWNTNDDIVVWLALDGNYAEYIAEHIEDVHAVLTDLAEAVADDVRQSVITSIEKILDHRSGMPASNAFRILLEDMNGEPSDEQA